MNSTQKKIVIGAALVAALMLIYPPFHFYKTGLGDVNLGYALIFEPPNLASRSNWVGIVNTDTLLTQWAGLILIAGALFFAFRDKAE